MKQSSNQNTKKVAAYTLGCKVNSYDTEAIMELFAKEGYEIINFEEYADIYIINTCTVTNLGDKKSRQIIRRAKVKNPNSIVVATGCYAQVSPEEVSKIEGVNLVLGTKDRKNIVKEVENYKNQGIITNVSNILDEKYFENLTVEKLENHTRALLKIQEGCSQFCSYCIIPYARGPVRSRKPEHVLEEVNTLVSNGFKEIVLAGIHVASYGKDLDDIDLTKLLIKVHDVDGLCRIRLSSIEPRVITEEFVNLMYNLPKICKHFHLSLQSGCDKTLKRMNRKYITEDYKKAVFLLRTAFPDIAITTDIIVGFPGETDEDFNESLSFVKEMELSKLHVFPYSPKKGTPSAKYPEQISGDVKSIRSKEMILLGETLSNNFKKNFLDETVEVLYEQETEGYFEGYTSNYIRVKTKCNENIINEILNVKIVDFYGDIAISNILQK